MNSLSHFDEQGASRMVDVGEKPVTRRMAKARGEVRMLPETLAKIQKGEHAKGNVLEVARLAGIMAAKKTPDWIPLCHPLPLEAVTIDFQTREVELSLDEQSGNNNGNAFGMVEIEATTIVSAKTGIEMEAMVAVSAAALTIYDMCKAVDRQMTISTIQLVEKSGGKSGHFVRK